MDINIDIYKEQSVWVTGCNGLLAQQLLSQMRELEMDKVFATDKEVDISKQESIDNFLSQHQGIQWIVNCAALTDVNAAERYPETANLINNIGARNIARAAKKINAKLIHISTSFVFDGKAEYPYTEESIPNPFCVYGKTKLDGEKAVLLEQNESYIIRTAWLYGPDGPNFVKTMVKLMNEHDLLNIANDQFGSPTFTGDLAFLIISFICPINYSGFPEKRPPYGLYNFTNLGKASYYDFACKIMELGTESGLIKHECTIKPISTSVNKNAGIYSPYSMLSSSKLQGIMSFFIPEWEDSLEFFLSQNVFYNETNPLNTTSCL